MPKRNSKRIEKYIVAFLVEFMGTLTVTTVYVMLFLYSIYGAALTSLFYVVLTYPGWYPSGAHFSSAKLITSLINGHSSLFYSYNEKEWTDSIVHNIIVFILTWLVQIGGGFLGVLIGMGFLGLGTPPAPGFISSNPFAAFFAMACGIAVISFIYISVTDKRFAYFTTTVMKTIDAKQNVGYINSYYGLAIGIADLVIAIATFAVTFGVTNGVIGFSTNIIKAIIDGDASFVGPAFLYLGSGIVGGIFAGFSYLLYAWLRVVSSI